MSTNPVVPTPSPTGSILPFSAGAAIAYGWRKTWKHFGWLLLLGLAVSLLTSIANLLTSGTSLLNADLRDPASVADTLAQASIGVLAIAGIALQFLISIYIGIGLIRIALGATAGQGIKLERLFSFVGFGRYLGASIIVGLIVGFAVSLPVIAGLGLTIAFEHVAYVLIGGLLAVVIAVVLSVGFSMFGYLILDQDIRGLGSLGASWRLVRPHFWGLIGLAILLGLISISVFVAAIVLGVLLLIVGLLATIPLAATVVLGITMLAHGYAYRTLSGQPVL